MAKEQMEERYQYKYPPFYRIIRIEFKDKNLGRVQNASAWFGQALEGKLSGNVLGPEPPSIGRIRNKFIYNLMVKIPKTQSLKATKQYVSSVERSFNSIKEFATVRINIDVDPY